jgi:hypothetical protein
MKALPRYLILSGLIVGYGLIFSTNDKLIMKHNVSLSYAKPTIFYEIVTGYLKHFSAEILFVKSSVFLGGAIEKKLDTSTYADVLSHNLKTMTELNPRFLAPYYYAQGFLPNISYKHAVDTNLILENGIVALPNDLFLHFLYGTNCFLHLNDPIKAAEVFASASKLQNAPPLFQHLSAILAAQGGEIEAGLVSLKTMMAVEQDTVVRNRYKDEIDSFEKALIIQNAMKEYTNKYGSFPVVLTKLVPEFLPEIPAIGSNFILDYEPPNLHLKRMNR